MNQLTSDQISTLKSDGYLFLQEFEPDISTYDVAARIGTIQDIHGIPTVQQLRPKERYGSTSNVYSGNYGLGEFPLHSDLAHWAMPPRYFMLRCVVPATDAYTFLFDVHKIIEKEANIIIERALFKPRKKISGHINLLRFHEIESGVDKYRWDNLFIVPDNQEANIIANNISDNYTSANSELRCYYTTLGDTVIVDNWKMFHGRSSVSVTDKDRLIERVYLSEILK